MGIIPVFFAVVNLSQPGMDTVSCIGGWGGKRGLRINYIYACARGQRKKQSYFVLFPASPCSYLHVLPIIFFIARQAVFNAFFYLVHDDIRIGVCHDKCFGRGLFMGIFLCKWKTLV